MKRGKICALLALAAMLLTLCACGNSPRVTPMKLSGDSEKVAMMLGQIHSAIFDYRVDGEAKTGRLTLYRLENSGWSKLKSCRLDPEEEYGREGSVGLSFGMDRIYVTIQQIQGGITNRTQWELPQSGTAACAFHQEKPADIQYGSEIPLAIQIFSDGTFYQGNTLDAFFSPWLLEQPEYLAVYAVTLRFDS